VTKKFEYTDIDGIKKEAETFIASEFVTVAAPNSPVMTTSSGTIHPSLLPPVAVGKAATVVITRKASEPILRGELVRGSSPNHVELADPTLDIDSASVLGMAITDAGIEDDVEILILGIITDSIFNVFGTNVPIFLDDAGGVTDVRPTVPTKNFLVDIGKSLGGGDILIFIQKPVSLGV
jgi:hypothetical protein